MLHQRGLSESPPPGGSVSSCPVLQQVLKKTAWNILWIMAAGAFMVIMMVMDVKRGVQAE